MSSEETQRWLDQERKYKQAVFDLQNIFEKEVKQKGIYVADDFLVHCYWDTYKNSSLQDEWFEYKAANLKVTLKPSPNTQSHE